MCQFLTGHASLGKAIEHTCIEIVTGTHRAHHLYLFHRIDGTDTTGKEPYITATVGKYEIRTIELYLLVIYLFGIVHLVEISEIVGRATYNVGKLKVLDESLGKLNALGNMVLPEVYIVEEHCTLLVGILKESLGLGTENGVQYKI